MKKIIFKLSVLVFLGIFLTIPTTVIAWYNYNPWWNYLMAYSNPGYGGYTYSSNFGFYPNAHLAANAVLPHASSFLSSVDEALGFGRQLGLGCPYSVPFTRHSSFFDSFRYRLYE